MMSARGTHKVPCVQFAFSDDTVLYESVGRAVDTRFTQTEPDATSWVKHTKGGLPTSGHWNFITRKTSVDVEQHPS
jgi:hypothetical protein